mgnify:CR=1 FL=1
MYIADINFSHDVQAWHLLSSPWCNPHTMLAWTDKHWTQAQVKSLNLDQGKDLKSSLMKKFLVPSIIKLRSFRLHGGREWVTLVSVCAWVLGVSCVADRRKGWIVHWLIEALALYIHATSGIPYQWAAHIDTSKEHAFLEAYIHKYILYNVLHITWSNTINTGQAHLACVSPFWFATDIHICKLINYCWME